ncbi:MAG: DUF1801 domain-containing protein [Rickettsiales bacterium]|nr:DUF1801 domain-containing protein [Rickettsiales bacterium]
MKQKLLADNLTPIKHEGVLREFHSYPKNICSKLLFLRKIIFESAKSLPEIGELEECLKWGEPAYLTSKTKTGSPVRLGWKKSFPNQYCICFNCNNSLVSSFKSLYGDKFKYGGNRSIIFSEHDKIPIEELSYCIKLALTYHLRKSKTSII